MMRVWPGRASPLGATWDGEGVNFALFSQVAVAVELCLFDHADDAVESRRVRLAERSDHVWHVYLPDVRPGQLYGFRVHGPYAPLEGSPLQPGEAPARPLRQGALGTRHGEDDHFGYTVGHPDGDLSLDGRDDAGTMPKSVVVDTAFTWGEDRPPDHPLHRSLLYECHVRGLTRLHPEVEPELRGTYLRWAPSPWWSTSRRSA
jgi:glycogen operon protein